MVSEYKRKRNNVLFYLAVCVSLGMLMMTSGCASTGVSKNQVYRFPNKLYPEALALVKDTEDTADYGEAVEKFKEFREKYPGDSRTEEAGAWIIILEKMIALRNIELESIKE